MKKLIALVLALAMVATLGLAFADAPTGTITISNAAKGIHYDIYKLFDATVGADGEIAYTSGTDGTIPNGLGDYFQKVTGTVNNVEEKEGTRVTGDKLSDAAVAALKTWTTTATKADADGKDGTGTAVSFTGLAYGYYVITSSQGDGKITVVTLNGSTASIVDKNTTEPDIQKKVKNAAGEWVEVTDANIGEVKEFKLDITTANWHEPYGGGEQKQIKQYIIGEDFATNKFELVSIDSIQIGTISEGTFTASTNLTVAEGATFPVTVDWVDGSGNSLYNNGVTIRIIYKAKLQDDALIDVGNENADLRGNVNTADLDWKYMDDTPHYGDGHDHDKDTATVDTYAIGLKKFNKEGTGLADATFQFQFYVKETPAADGSYIYAGTEPGEGLTNTITTPAGGQITIKGVKAGTYSGIAETVAPNGYNRTSDTFSVTATKISSTTTVTTTEKKWKIDQNGGIHDYSETVESSTETTYTNANIAVTAIPVINLTGTVLPSTGGIGTTIFYILGGLLVIGAAVILVARRKAQD
jgi:fimbrial isopeptide formation D2 family protein/LPXTG-motif cell wall-anchored protein